MDIHVALVTNNECFAVDGDHQFNPLGLFFATRPPLLEISQFANVMYLAVFLRTTKFASIRV